MSAALSPAVGAVRWPRSAPGLVEALDAMRSLDRRHWAAALAIGGALGLGHGLHFFARLMPADNAGAVLAHVLLHFTLMNSLGAVLVMLGVARLDRPVRGATAGPMAYMRLVGFVALAMGVLDLPCGLLVEAICDALGQPLDLRALSSSWLDTALESFGSALMHLVPLLPATLCYMYMRNARRTAEQLATAQLRHAEIERRLLAERLAGAQALVEPAFLFDTLRLAERLFERDARSGQRLLDELIAYLRAALPPLYGSGSTLGQQAELLRAYLQVERIRLGGRLNPHIDVPAELACRPFAPLLLLPLAAQAVRQGVEPCGDGDVTVRAQIADGRLAVEVADSGPARADAMKESPVLTGVRDLLVRLYGDGARLTLTDVAPAGFAARLEVAG